MQELKPQPPRPTPEQFRRQYNGAQSLLDDLDIERDAAWLAQAALAERQFTTRVTGHYASLIDACDPNDPLLRQILPDPRENQHTQDELIDPVGDEAASPYPGLIHKYPSRALVISHPACVIHCRYCFRRHFDYAEHHLRPEALQDIANYLAQHSQINELILSGGDPLSQSNARLEQQIHTLLAQAPHIRTLRIHTRTPVAQPERIDDALIALLRATGRNIVLVLHINHPREVSPELTSRIEPARQALFTVLNQAVLLHGVNDDAPTLGALQHACFSAGILPYYLNLLDRVQGSGHFLVSDERARALMHDLRVQLPGYLVPRLVRETRGAAYKLPVNEGPP